MSRKINVGCGDHLLLGFENIDSHAVNNNPEIIIANALEYDYRRAEIVYVGHFIEHMTVDDARALMRRIFDHAPEAMLIITVPAVDRCAGVPFWWLQHVIFGARRWPGDDHKSAWRVQDLAQEMRDVGYKKIEEWADCTYLADKVDWQVCLKAML